MKKTFNLFQTKTFLKYLITILFILLAGSLFLLKSNPYKIPLEPKKKNKSAEIKNFIDKADTFYDNNKLDSSFYYYNKALLFCDSNIDSDDYVYILSSMADIQAIYSDYISSEATLTKVLPYLKNVKNPRIVRNVYSYIANNYYNTYDYSNAILYHKKALKLPGTPFKKSLILTDIAIVYIQEKKYQKAADLLEILASKKIIYNKDLAVSDRHHAFVLNNLAFCYFNLENPKALNLYQQSLKTSIQLKDDFGLIHVYKYFSIFHQKDNPQLAKEFAKKSYTKACIINSATNKANSLAQLIQTCEGNELKKYSLAYIKIIDSITTGRRKAKNQFAQIKYDFKKDKVENLHLKSQKIENELQLERQKKRNIILYIIIIFTLVLIIFLYLHLTSKGKREKNEAVYKSEMRISKKLDDELANDVSSALAFAENEDLELRENKERLLNNLDTIYSRTRNISKENSPITTDENYAIALKEMISEFKTSDINILLNGLDTIPWNQIDKNKKITVYRVLQELFLNMKKHSQASLVSINFKIKNKSIAVNYTDNGVGLNNKNIILKNGLQNVESRIKTINGTIIFDINSKKGFKLSFDFPI